MPFRTSRLSNSLSIIFCKDVASDPRPCGFVGTVCSKGQGQDAATSVATEVALVSSNARPLVRGMSANVSGDGNRRRDGHLESLPKCPTVSSVHRCVETGWGVHLQDLTAAGYG